MEKNNGFQISHKTSLPNIPNIDKPLDNTFRLTDMGAERTDFIYTQGLIQKTKYDRILYQEVLIALRVKGKFIIKLNKFTKEYIEKIKNDVLLVGKGKFSIALLPDSKSQPHLIFVKNKSYLTKGDTIFRWTFGIITNGTRDDFIEKFIESVEVQKIPNYEIIICGKLENESLVNKYQNVKFIFFDKKSDKGWITKKKNIICENAKYENMMIVHDRFYLEDNWFKGMKKYGNYFEVLGCHQNYKNYELGWSVCMGHSNLNFDLWGNIQIVHKLDTSDWCDRICSHHGVSILKKSIWKIAKWNENRFWNEKDDVELSFREYEKGIMIRFNPFSKIMVAYSRRGLHRVIIKKNRKKNNWFRWKGPVLDILYYRIFLIKQMVIGLFYIVFKIDLFDINISDKIPIEKLFRQEENR